VGLPVEREEQQAQAAHIPREGDKRLAAAAAEVGMGLARQLDAWPYWEAWSTGRAAAAAAAPGNAGQAQGVHTSPEGMEL
jgi:hypothetical protein